MAEDAAKVAPDVYMLTDGKARFTEPSGEGGELEVTAGTGMWREAEEHATENVGDSELRALFFEPK